MPIVSIINHSCTIQSAIVEKKSFVPFLLLLSFHYLDKQKKQKKIRLFECGVRAREVSRSILFMKFKTDVKSLVFQFRFVSKTFIFYALSRKRCGAMMCVVSALVLLHLVHCFVYFPFLLLLLLLCSIIYSLFSSLFNET